MANLYVKYEAISTIAMHVRPTQPWYRLVIVEGIMGSGKLTTMRLIATALDEAGFTSQAIHERTDPHPFRATDELTHWFEPWLDSTPHRLAQSALLRWKNFVDQTNAESVLPVMDGQLFHGDLTNLFLMEASYETIASYCDGLAEIISQLDPLVIYFWQGDVDRAIKKVCTERGEAWMTYQVDWKLKSPYAVRRGLTGLEGLQSLYGDYRKLTDSLFSRLKLDKLAIENSRQDWSSLQTPNADATWHIQ